MKFVIVIILLFIFKYAAAQDPVEVAESNENKVDTQENLSTAGGSEMKIEESGDDSSKGFGLGKKFGFLGEMADSFVDMLRLLAKSYFDLDLEELKRVKFPTDQLLEPGGESCNFTLPFKASDLVGKLGARLQHFKDLFRSGKYAEIHIYENFLDNPKEKPLNVDFLVPRNNDYTDLERRLRVSLPNSDGDIALYRYVNGTTEELLEKVLPSSDFFAKERRFSLHVMEKRENWDGLESQYEYVIEVKNKCRLFTFIPPSWLEFLNLRSKVLIRYPLLIDDDLKAGDDMLNGFWMIAGFASAEEAPPVLLQACFQTSLFDVEPMSCASPLY